MMEESMTDFYSILLNHLCPVVGVLALLILGHAMLVARLLDLVEPFATKLADSGEKLLAMPQIADWEKERIRRILDNPIQRKQIWALAFIYMPFLVQNRVKRWLKIKPKEPRPGTALAANRPLTGEFVFAHYMASAAAAPIPAFFVALQILVCYLFIRLPANIITGIVKGVPLHVFESGVCFDEREHA